MHPADVSLSLLEDRLSVPHGHQALSPRWQMDMPVGSHHSELRSTNTYTHAPTVDRQHNLLSKGFQLVTAVLPGCWLLRGTVQQLRVLYFLSACACFIPIQAIQTRACLEAFFFLCWIRLYSTPILNLVKIFFHVYSCHYPNTPHFQCVSTMHCFRW